MISGAVNAYLEPIVALSILDRHGQPHPVDAVIDTGFSGYLTLSPALITSLGLRWLMKQQGTLADGTVHVFDVYVGTLVWDGSSLDVQVEAADNEPLLGMNQMAGHDLRIRIQKGGAVELTAIP